MKELINLINLSAYEFYAPNCPDISNTITLNLAVYSHNYNKDYLAKLWTMQL